MVRKKVAFAVLKPSILWLIVFFKQVLANSLYGVQSIRNVVSRNLTYLAD